MKLKDSSICRSCVERRRKSNLQRIHIYKDISPIDFATQTLAIHYNYMHLLKYTRSELYRIDIGN
jgi:hypothetical protein